MLESAFFLLHFPSILFEKQIIKYTLITLDQQLRSEFSHNLAVLCLGFAKTTINRRSENQLQCKFVKTHRFCKFLMSVCLLIRKLLKIYRLSVVQGCHVTKLYLCEELCQNCRGKIEVMIDLLRIFERVFSSTKNFCMKEILHKLRQIRALLFAKFQESLISRSN